jgi:hypothetical protein
MRLVLAADSTLDSVAGGSEEADVAVMLLLVISVSDTVVLVLPASFRDCSGKEILLTERSNTNMGEANFMGQECHTAIRSVSEGQQLIRFIMVRMTM